MHRPRGSAESTPTRWALASRSYCSSARSCAAMPDQLLAHRAAGLRAAPKDRSQRRQRPVFGKRLLRPWRRRPAPRRRARARHRAEPRGELPPPAALRPASRRRRDRRRRVRPRRRSTRDRRRASGRCATRRRNAPLLAANTTGPARRIRPASRAEVPQRPRPSRWPTPGPRLQHRGPCAGVDRASLRRSPASAAGPRLSLVDGTATANAASTSSAPDSSPRSGTGRIRQPVEPRQAREIESGADSKARLPTPRRQQHLRRTGRRTAAPARHRRAEARRATGRWHGPTRAPPRPHARRAARAAAPSAIRFTGTARLLPLRWHTDHAAARAAARSSRARRRRAAPRQARRPTHRPRRRRASGRRARHRAGADPAAMRNASAGESPLSSSAASARSAREVGHPRRARRLPAPGVAAARRRTTKPGNDHHHARHRTGQDRALHSTAAIPTTTRPRDRVREPAKRRRRGLQAPQPADRRLQPRRHEAAAATRTDGRQSEPGTPVIMTARAAAGVSADFAAAQQSGQQRGAGTRSEHRPLPRPRTAPCTCPHPIA